MNKKRDLKLSKKAMALSQVMILIIGIAVQEKRRHL